MTSSGAGVDQAQSRAEFQLPLPGISQGQPTGILLRFPWGKRVVDLPLLQSSFTLRESRYLSWMFSEPSFPISATKVNHLLFTALPRSYYPGKLIRAGRKERMKARWRTHGHT